MSTLLAQLTGRPLARPCDEPWERMHGDALVRRCAACARDVYDVSAMTAPEAELRLLNAGGTPCIRYLRRPDGTIVHAAIPPRSTSSSAPPRSLVAAAALGVTLSAAAHADEAKRTPPKAPAACVAYAQPEAPIPGTAALAEAPAEPPPPDQPVRLAGEPMAVPQPQAFGTLVLKSKVAREVTIVGIKLSAPLTSYLLTPGDFSADVREPNGKVRQVRFKIHKDKKTVLDLDKR